MRILVVTPAARGSRAGNRVTALRWARTLRGLGHVVRVANGRDGWPADLLVALHARRSAAAVRGFLRARPGRPVIVALTGTDLYRDLGRSAAARRCLEAATRIVALQPEALRALPPSLRRKTRPIWQSAPRIARRAPRPDVVEVLVVGHLRAVKDPFRAVRAVRRLPAATRVRIVQAGAALGEAMARRARREQAANPRYAWIGDVPRSRVARLMSRARALVVSSRMEGGANVVAEAVRAGLPVLASRIPGNVGMLGHAYPGYFEPMDTDGLARLLRRLEHDQAFAAALRRACARLAGRFAPARESRAWRRVLAEACRARAGRARRRGGA
jgi:putative glycosyltransferase (TIGR04348 family)